MFEEVNIGSLKVFPVFLAPMAGITDSVFRRLVRSMGCGLLFTEMVSAKGLLFQGEKTKRLLSFKEEERPIGVQIFGHSPHEMARGAALIEERYEPDLIDINMGCPVKKVIKTGAGASLMRDPKRACKIVREVVSSVDLPVTVKIRAGWNRESRNAPYLAPLLEEAGADSITVHGRTREEFYQGRADWDIIEEVKERVSIPVIGNGDIFSPREALRYGQMYSVDGVMVGRGAMGNPWIFRRIKDLLLQGEEGEGEGEGPSFEERISLIMEHLKLLVEEKGEYRAVREMRKHCGWYLKGLPRVKAFKVAINKATSREEVEELLKDLLVSRTSLGHEHR